MKLEVKCILFGCNIARPEYNSELVRRYHNNSLRNRSLYLIDICKTAGEHNGRLHKEELAFGDDLIFITSENELEYAEFLI